MPHPKVIEKIKEVASSKGLDENVASRIVAYLNSAESSDFSKMDRLEQINLIIEAIPSAGSSNEEEEVDCED